MSEKRLWYIAKGHQFEDLDNDVCRAFGSVYCAVAENASAAQNAVERYLKTHPGDAPISATYGTVSMHESDFSRPVGNQPASAAQEDGVYVFDSNIQMYDNVSERYAWKSATRNARAKPLYAVSSFDNLADQFIKYPSRFKDMPLPAINAVEEGIIARNRSSIESKLQYCKYNTFIEGLQGQPYSKEDKYFIEEKLTDTERKVVVADTALSEVRNFTFMGINHQVLGFPSGREVFDHSFSDIQSELDIEERVAEEKAKDEALFDLI